MANRNVARAVRMALFAAGAAGAGIYAPGASAQDPQLEQIVVTGSRIARQDFIANSPIASVSQEQIVGNADVTLDTFLNTLPQVNPAGGTTSNNPGNAGQSNIDLRGLGSNRNIVLIDGRRPMVSAQRPDGRPQHDPGGDDREHRSHHRRRGRHLRCGRDRGRGQHPPEEELRRRRPARDLLERDRQRRRRGNQLFLRGRRQVRRRPRPRAARLRKRLA